MYVNTAKERVNSKIHTHVKQGLDGPSTDDTHLCDITVRRLPTIRLAHSIIPCPLTAAPLVDGTRPLALQRCSTSTKPECSPVGEGLCSGTKARSLVQQPASSGRI